MANATTEQIGLIFFTVIFLLIFFGALAMQAGPNMFDAWDAVRKAKKDIEDMQDE